MADQIKLVLRADGGSDIDSMDLVPHLAYRGWRQAVSKMGADVDEALTLNLKGASDDHLARVIQKLDRFIVSANRNKASPLELYGLWLRVKLAGETNARQAYILEAQHQSFNPTSEYRDSHVVDGDVLGLKRTGGWEDVSETVYSAVSLSSLGGMAQLSAAVGGDMDGRIYKTVFWADYDPAATPMNKSWLGLRSERFGNPANFVPVWEAENGSKFNSAANSTAKDSTASPAGAGTNKSVNFPISSTLTKFWSRTLRSVSPTHYTDQRGKFLVLARICMSDGSTTAHVQLRSGSVDSTQMRTHPRGLTSGIYWRMYTLGQVEFPSAGRTIFDVNQMGAESLQVYAERLTGSGSLYLDCLVLIPIGEGFVYQNGGTIYGVNGNETDVYQAPDGSYTALSFTSSGSQETDIDIQVSGGMPIGNVYGVVAADYNVTGQPRDEVMWIDLHVFKRYATLRGAA